MKDGKDGESDGQSVFTRKQSVLSIDTSQDLSQSQDISQGKQSITTLDTGEYHIKQYFTSPSKQLLKPDKYTYQIQKVSP